MVALCWLKCQRQGRVRGVIQRGNDGQTAILAAVVAALVDMLQKCVAVGKVVFDILPNLAEGRSDQFRKSAIGARHDCFLSELMRTRFDLALRFAQSVV